MGQKEVKPQLPPQKTPQQMVKEFGKSISKLRMDFDAYICQLRTIERQYRTQLQKMIKKNGLMSQKRAIAEKLLRSQLHIQRFQKLDVQLQDVLFQLKTVTNTGTLLNVMKGLGEMTGKSNTTIDVRNFQQAMALFNTQMGKESIIGSDLQKTVNHSQGEIEHQAISQLISQMCLQCGTRGQGENQRDENQLVNFQDRINSIK